MRIYAHKEIKKNVLTQLAPYFTETKQLHYLLNKSDLFQLEHNKIYYVQQSKKNEPKVKTLFGAFPITIDKTEYLREMDESYQIPPQCKSEILLQKIYKPSPTSLVEWVFVYADDRLKENYFAVPAGTDINEPGVKADLMWGLCLAASQALTPA